MGITTRNEGSKITSEINVAPMTDVMLVLLIIFMVIAPLLGPGVPVDMVGANNAVAMPDAEKEGVLLVAVTRDGRMYLGSEQIAPDGLTARLKNKLERSHDKRVFVKANAHAKYGAVAGVIDSIRSADVQDVGLLTERKRHMIPLPASLPDAHRKIS